MLTFTPSILLRDVAKGRFGEAAMPWWAPVERQFRAGIGHSERAGLPPLDGQLPARQDRYLQMGRHQDIRS